MSALVESWFGEKFVELHPLLQRLHRDGGTLRGDVEVSLGRGIAGFIGKRIAARLGVPTTSGTHRLEVAIHSDAELLHWDRRFDGRSEFRSGFRPFGEYPAGHWIEQSGAFCLTLGVRVVDGGWHWQYRSTRFRGVRVPKAFHPVTAASKRIEGGDYRFSVEVGSSVLGKLFAYSGKLALIPT